MDIKAQIERINRSYILNLDSEQKINHSTNDEKLSL